MKFKPGFFALTTAAIVTITFSINSIAAAIQFTDISNLSSKDKIVSLQERGVVKGDGKGLFAPNNLITAAEGIQFIVNAFGLNIDNIRFIKEPMATDYFPNAKNDAWYSNTLIIAAMNGLDLPKDLKPQQLWTREEFTYYLIKVMEKVGDLPMIKLVPAEISDQDKLSAQYQGAVQRAIVYKVVKLDEKGRFNPKEKVKRSEAAEAVYNVLEYLSAHKK